MVIPPPPISLSSTVSSGSALSISDSVYIQPAERYSHTLKNILKNEQEVIKNCSTNATTNECRYRFHYALWYLRKPRVQKHLPNAHQSAQAVLNILYNGDNAQNLFLSRINDINTRANFFAVNHLYYQQSTNPVRWFGIADKVSRECVTGLGAKHCASYIPFGLSKVFGNPAIYQWRQVGGETLLANGFSNFKALFNTDLKGNLSEARAWDITQLNREQSLLQPIHEAFLGKHPLFIKANKTIMRLRIRGGVNILNQADRVRYGCLLLGYGVEQGCRVQ